MEHRNGRINLEMRIKNLGLENSVFPKRSVLY